MKDPRKDDPVLDFQMFDNKIKEKNILLVGSDHVRHDYDWIVKQLETFNPECITLEQSLDTSKMLFWEFEHELERLVEEQKRNKAAHALGEFAAGVHHARKNNLPVYCIDKYEPFEVAIHTNMNENDNHEMLRDLKSKKSYKSTSETEFEKWTCRNLYMARAINYHLQCSGMDSLAHIGGRGHYDSKRCLPLQKLVKADSICIIDAVEKTKYRMK